MNNYYFITLTVNQWTSVFKDFPETNDMILNSFEYLVVSENVAIYAFVIMKDHVHVVLQTSLEISIRDVIRRLKSFTGKTIIEYLKDKNQDYLIKNFATSRKDRLHKFWKIKSGCLELKHCSIIKQKIRYTHLNPTKRAYKEVDDENDYKYSSANSYLINNPEFSFLNLYSE